MAASFDEGTTWGFTPITDQPWDPAIGAPYSHGDSNATFIGEYFGFDAGKSEFHVLWTDTRFNNQDLFYCQVLTEKTRDLADGLGLAIDPMALILSGRAYLIWVEMHHPHVEIGLDLKNILPMMTAEERRAALARAKSLSEFGSVAKEVIEAFNKALEP